MCGIFCSVFNPDFQKVFTGLKRLEYRGYDSWGFGALTIDTTSPGQFIEKKGLGPLPDTLDLNEFKACQAILSHVRWASSSPVTLANAHPIIEGNICVVLNGTIENWRELRDKYGFKGDSDTQILAEWLDCNGGFLGFDELKGSYAFVFIYDDGLAREVNFVVNGSPLYITDDGYISSDLNSLSGISFDKVYKLKEKSWGYYDLKDTGFQVIGGGYMEVVLPALKQEQFKSEGFHMLSEIKEQPSLIRKINNISLPDILDYDSYILYGCGSSYISNLLGEKLFRIQGWDARAYYATELESDLDWMRIYPNTLFICTSQSGETRDCIGVYEKLQEDSFVRKNCRKLCITNNKSSKIAQLSDIIVDIEAGPELAVAATKSFSQTCLLLYRFAQDIVALDEQLSNDIQIVIDNQELPKIARLISHFKNMFCFGRDYMYVAALEGALKIKEVSSIHAEAGISSEHRHGPLALTDESTLGVFLIGLEGDYLSRVLSNMEQVKARKGRILTVCPEKYLKRVAPISDFTITYPTPIYDIYCPLVANVVMQLLSYYIALEKGLNPDRPRSLAKAISVV